MSTRSNIYLKLKDETKGQTLKFDFSKLPRGNGEDHAELEYPIKDVQVPKNALYMRVYHHWDGYVTGVGKTLAETYHDYDTILNLLTMGDLSSINDGVTSYQGWRNENTPPQFLDKGTKVSKWKPYKIPRIKSVVTDMFGRVLEGKIVPDPTKFEKTEIIEARGRIVKENIILKDGTLDPIAAVCEEYAYLFDGDKWYVSYCTYDDNDKRVDTGWLDLKEELAKWEERENKANA